MQNRPKLNFQTLMTKITSMSADGTSTLPEVLSLCKGEGVGPQSMPTWITCLSNVYQASLTAPTATEYANAIYSVWAPAWSGIDGTASIESSTTTLTGTGTSFTGLVDGDSIQLIGATDPIILTVANVTSATELTVTEGPARATTATNLATSGPRVNYSEMQTALAGIKTSAKTAAYSSTDVATAAKVNFYDITISINVADLVAEYPNVPDGNYGHSDVNPFVIMADNHPGHGSGEGTNELQSEGLTPNMTIHWTAINTPSAAKTVQLLKFQNDPQQLQDWKALASIPASMPDHADQKVCRALASLPIETSSAQYSFYFSVDGGPALYLFDPFMGDRDE